VLATPAQAPTAASAPGALIEAAVGSLSKTLHPYPDSAAYTQAWTDVAALIWGGADGSGALLAFDWETLDYRPAMARELPRISTDGRTFTFTLRDDLKWSDGAPISVDDFQFAFEQASREENHYVQVDLLQEVASLRALDARTLEISLKSAKPRDVSLAIVNIITPVPKHVWAGRPWTDPTVNPEIFKPSVVLGPYRVQDFQPAQRGVFLAVDTYFAGKPRVPRVEIVVNPSFGVAYEALKNGSVNWVHALQPAQYQAANANPDVDVHVWTAANATYRTLEFNVARPFLSDRRVRQALAHAVNRADLIELAEQDLAVAQYSFVQPTNSRWVNGGVIRYEFDLSKARQLLQDAGYRLQNSQLVGKDGQTVKVQVVLPSSSPSRAKIATYLQQRYRELGIDVAVTALEFNAYTNQVQNQRDFDISLASYGGGSIDPDLGPRAQLVTNGAQNVTGYSNPEVDDLFKQAGNEPDTVRRKQLYDQIQMLVSDDVPSHYLYALKSIDAYSKNVHGVTTHKGDRLDTNDALLRWSVDP
jgi:peptide/nickel transport system substrate-binding protein